MQTQLDNFLSFFNKGSTLASRDSVTQDQARKLKKSLQQNRQQLNHKAQLYGRSDTPSSRKVCTSSLT